MKAKNTDRKEFPEYDRLQLSSIDKEILAYWKKHDIFNKSITSRPEDKSFVFYEGPPSINALPGIHHVISRTIKDTFARYRTQKGFRVERKGGWDTHGLPIELNVEKTLGITKKDIGVSISVEDYNKACRTEVVKFKDKWDEITEKMGYWVDLNDPYITYKNEYIESLWALLKMIHSKGYLYQDYSIQPFSPAAGTQLSSHELNQPGCYRQVKDTTVTAQFKLKGFDNRYILAWTTTPWTLPSNTALAVGEKITYQIIKTVNPYTGSQMEAIVAKELVPNYFKEELKNTSLSNFKLGDKDIPWLLVEELSGKQLEGLQYEQLLPYVQPDNGKAFEVIIGDFVSTEDGTGIVHIAPSFGADDMRVAKQHGFGSLTLVNRQGRFVDEVTDFANRAVKDFYNEPNYQSVDVDIVIKLKQENKAFRVEKMEHSYPHCWRTDKPVIYYPLDSWFIKTTAVKSRMVELNNTINWKPKSTGEGRFGQWLENVIDWNVSRSRYWGTPLPIWRTEDKTEEKCMGSLAELRAEVEKAVKAGFMKAPLPADFDLHKPYVDEVFLCSDLGKKMYREEDLVDVWFDSGAMPYAQWHFPIENEEKFRKNFPADFIAEGVDQTRGWFYTLHAIAVMLFDSVAYKNVISNGLVLDKNGQKMSKRLGNGVDPFATIEKYGADATRWYMLGNSQPWDNLKFDLAGIDETTRKFFGTLYNTYSFFALYANIDGFKNEESPIALKNRPEIDRWILSKLHSLIKSVDVDFNDYEPTRAIRAIEHFVDEHLSNWYVRLCRRRFWKGEYSEDKISAYQTLLECLETLSKLMAPVAPFFADFLYLNLSKQAESVHLDYFPNVDEAKIDEELEIRMQIAQSLSSMVLSLRKKEKIKVRQPLSKMMIPVSDALKEERIRSIEAYVLNEVNVKEIEYVKDTANVVVKKVKADFKVLGPKYGPQMKEISRKLADLSQPEINNLEKTTELTLSLADQNIKLNLQELEILSEDIPGWLVQSMDDLTVALDVNITAELEAEGFAREFVNRVQNLRKEKDFNVIDRISVQVQNNPIIHKPFELFAPYIQNEVLAERLVILDQITDADVIDVNENNILVKIDKI